MDALLVEQHAAADDDPGLQARPWRAVLWLSAVVFVCWVVPWLLGRGPLGSGVIQIGMIYAGWFAAIAWLGCLAVALVPARFRRALMVRLLVVGLTLPVLMPLGDVACTIWSIQARHIWYYALSFSRAVNMADHQLIWKRRPGLSWRGRKTPECQEVSYRTDERGFRNRPGIEHADIVFVGDSVTEAGEVDEEATFVRKTAAALGMETVNLGTSGYGPQQELAVLKRYGFSYNPRLVVWQVTEWNDIQDALMYQGRDDPRAQELPPWDVLYARHSPMMQLTSALLPGKRPNGVAFEATGGQVEDRAFWPYQPNLHALLPQGFAETKSAIAEAFQECQSRGVEFVVLYIPAHVRVLLPYMRFASEAERNRFCPDGKTDRPDDLAHAMAEFCAGLGCPMIDMCPPLRLRAALDNRRIYVPNDPHLGIDGHDEVHLALVNYAQTSTALRDRVGAPTTAMAPRGAAAPRTSEAPRVLR